MGSCVSNETEEEEAKSEEAAPAPSKKVALQRRRLSLQPAKVGDVTKTYNRKESLPSEDKSAMLVEQNENNAKVLADATSSRKGYVPYNRGKVNQDRALIAYKVKKDPTMSIFGVMDGHGEYGHLVSDFVMKNLKKYLEQEQELKNDPEQCIKTAVDNLVTALNKKKINCHFSGTTCVFSLLIEGILYNANIGDSRVVMARRTEGKLEAIELSHDQKPEVPKEAARIREKGGRIQTLPGPANEDCGPLRVWLAEVNVPGLAMSRSIGDNVCQDVGVIHEPEVIAHEIQQDDLFAVWASDGVWEFLSNEQVINIVWEHKSNLKVAANKLVEASTNEWRRHEEVIDDITCVIVQFNKF